MEAACQLGQQLNLAVWEYIPNLQLVSIGVYLAVKVGLQAVGGTNGYVFGMFVLSCHAEYPIRDLESTAMEQNTLPQHQITLSHTMHLLQHTQRSNLDNERSAHSLQMVWGRITYQLGEPPSSVQPFRQLSTRQFIIRLIRTPLKRFSYADSQG